MSDVQKQKVISLPNRIAPSHEYGSQNKRRHFHSTMSSTPQPQNMQPQNQVIYQTQVHNMNVNLELDAKSLDTMARAQGKNYFKHYKAATQAKRQKQARADEEEDPVLTFRQQPYSVGQSVNKPRFTNASENKRRVPAMQSQTVQSSLNIQQNPMSPQSNEKTHGLNKRWVRNSEGKWVSDNVSNCSPDQAYGRPFSQDREEGSSQFSGDYGNSSTGQNFLDQFGSPVGNQNQFSPQKRKQEYIDSNLAVTNQM